VQNLGTLDIEKDTVKKQDIDREEQQAQNQQKLKEIMQKQR
jgi:hypothetical protein